VTTTEKHPNHDRQIDLECEMRALGVKRYREIVEGAKENGQEASTRAVKRLIDRAHQLTKEAIQGWMDAANSGKAGRKFVASQLLAGVDLDLVAHLTVRSVLDSLSSRERLQSVSSGLAMLIEDELRFRHFKEADKDGYWWTQKKVEKSTHGGHKHRVMKVMMKKRGVEWQDWAVKDRVLVGSKLVELFCAATGMAKIELAVEGRNNRAVYVVGTEETLAWLAKEHSNLEWMSPVYMPMVCPPRPWTSPTEGGYLSGRVRRLTLVKTTNKAYVEELSGTHMPEVYEALNAIQNTAWQINPRVLEVMLEAQARAASFADILPPVDDMKVEDEAPRPAWLTKEMKQEDMTEEQVEQFRLWKRSVSQLHELNAKLRSKRMQWSRMLWVAERFKDEEEMFFPHQLDWRGRIYPVPLYLHPQGHDACRGLLQFSRAVPIQDDEGALWLAVHGAGCWGVDKVSLEDRRAWVLEHERAILSSAEDPLTNRFWTEAEKPWQALAFCLDWAGFRAEGFDYLSQLPVQMDGTCNGLQNFSAILRDEVGGKAVNLLPGDKPNDIYTDVAELVIKRVEEDAMGGNEIAAGWIGRVTRKVTKRPVMTLAYGASRYGFAKMVFEDTISPLRAECKRAGDKGAFPWAGNGFDAATYMGGLIWECVGKVVQAAARVMEWLQGAAKVAASEELPVIWHAPTGFMVQQSYKLPNTVSLQLTFDKVRITLAVANDGMKIDSRKQAAGISPNWVHSLDAAHLMRTVVRVAAEGIQSVSMIHDSYGTHAGNAWALARCLREEFVRMYSETDVLARFKADLQAMLPENKELPELPIAGSLDLSQVLESPFFFA
jgi:DNA-directed RNA polymerase